MLKQLFFCAALSWMFIILFFCLTPSSNIPVVGIPNLDKFVHAFFYFVFVLLCFLFFRKQFINTSNRMLFIILFLFSFFYGIGIEIVQGVFTTTRKADLFDVLANMSGVVLAIFSITSYFKIKQVVKS